MSAPSPTGVKVYGCNHVAIEVDDIEKAVAFYKDVFNLEQMKSGEGDAFFKLGEHQFLAIFEVEKTQPVNVRHFGIMVRDEKQLEDDSPTRGELQDAADEYPGSWFKYLVDDTLSNGEEYKGVNPKYRPRGYNEGPKKDE